MRTVKSIISCILCFALMLSFYVSAESFAGYTAISTKEELAAVANSLSGSYYLTQDIIFSEEDFLPGGAFYNEGSGWLPLGANASKSFKGKFDGNGHKIQGIRINVETSGTFFGGLFGYSQGTIKNVIAEDIEIYVSGMKYAYVGGIVGASSKGGVSNCLVTGHIEVTGGTISSSVGGIVGGAYTGVLTGCENRADVIAEGSSVNAGGIAGTSSINITECANTGYVEAVGRGDVYVGGIVGDGKNVTDCFNIGGIKCSSKCDGYGGGIAGRSQSTISDCYNAGAIKLTANTFEYCGAVAGKTTGSVTQCYYLKDTAEAAVSEGSASAVALTTTNFSNAATFSNFDFANKWVAEGDVIRPKKLAGAFPVDLYTVCFSDYTGKEIAVRIVPEGEVLNEIQYPEYPQRTGYVTTGWSGAINIPVTQNVAVAPFYEKDSSYIYNVGADGEIVEYPNGQDYLNFEDRVTVTATKPNFSYWKIGDTVVSTSPVYSFLTMGDAELTAVYGAESPEPAVFLHPTSVVTSIATYYYKFSMVGSSFIPEGYTFVEAGILLAADDQSDNAESFVIGSTDFKVVKQKVNAAYANSQFMITLTNVSKSASRSGRAYMILADADGNQTTYYSNEIAVASF